jgi:cation diffusion facilitator family transporter
MSTQTHRGVRSAQLGLLVNALLAVVKLVAGLVGHSYALVADAVESSADVFSSIIVWSGLRVASRDPDDIYPFGYGKAESIATAAVALMLLAAAALIAVESIDEIATPHLMPAPWTLAVLVSVVAIKTLLSRRTHAVGAEIGSTAVKADAWHHLSDALTSTAAFIGISIALIGGRGWEPADDWAALVAAAIVAFNGFSMLRTALHDLMDRMPLELADAVRAAAESVDGVCATEQIAVRKSGLSYRATLHVQADPSLSLHEAHILSGRVKGAIRSAVPQVAYVLVHMEPYER